MQTSTQIKNSPAPHSCPLLRYTQRIFFICGSLALAYVAFTLIQSSIYQHAANQFLNQQVDIAQQIQREQGHAATLSAPAIVPAKISEGDLLGRLEIPRLGLRVAVLEGTTSHTLRLGAGHIDGTAVPGAPGNIGIAAHRDTFFRSLKDIRKDDQIQIQTTSGLTVYQVDWTRIVSPADVAVLAPSTQSALTLVTCYPFYYVGSAPQRFIVHAHKL
jgi:sortase A